MRLGCINHALLTAQAIRHKNLRLAAWVANRIDPDMDAFDENLHALETRLSAPLLGIIPYQAEVNLAAASGLMDLDILNSGKEKYSLFFQKNHSQHHKYKHYINVF
jgi:dethiobiotin synthetase